jgi:hypothetical protein
MLASLEVLIENLSVHFEWYRSVGNSKPNLES